jgi:hypothetical protein
VNDQAVSNASLYLSGQSKHFTSNSHITAGQC